MRQTTWKYLTNCGIFHNCCRVWFPSTVPAQFVVTQLLSAPSTLGRVRGSMEAFLGAGQLTAPQLDCALADTGLGNMAGSPSAACRPRYPDSVMSGPPSTVSMLTSTVFTVILITVAPQPRLPRSVTLVPTRGGTHAPPLSPAGDMGTCDTGHSGPRLRAA